MAPVTVDSHAHLDDPRFEGDLDAVVARAREAGVDRILSAGTDPASSRRACAIAERFPEVYFAAGIHPHEADRFRSLEEIRDLLSHPRAVALGETGLDYAKKHASEENQKELFARHLELAGELGKPVVIHCREAYGDLRAILRPYLPLRGVFHCFSGGFGDIEFCLAYGLYLSVAGPVTFPKAEEFREVVRSIPLDHLLLETDCPYLAPQPRRGERNEPAFVRHTAEAVAALLERPREEVEEAASRNARDLFGWA
jgi:TatD DNase family protein